MAIEHWIVLAGAIGGALLTARERRIQWTLTSLVLCGLLSFILVKLTLLAPFTLGPEGPWLGLGGAAIGGQYGRSKANTLWPNILLASLFLPVWAEAGWTGLLILGACVWRHWRSDPFAQGPGVRELRGMIVFTSAMLYAPQAAAGNGAVWMGVLWALVMLFGWIEVTKPDLGPHQQVRGMLAMAVVFAYFCGVWTLGFDGQLACLLMAIMVIEGLSRPSLPWWWYVVLPGMFFVGFDVTRTFCDLILPLGMVALCTRLIRLPTTRFPGVDESLRARIGK